MNEQMLALRDDMADMLGLAPKQAHEGEWRHLLNRFLIESQRLLYRQYEFDALKQYWQLFTAAGVNLYPYPNAGVAWTANTNMVVNQLIKDSNNNYQIAGQTGSTGAVAPVWNVAVDGATVDNGVTWINLGPTAPPTPDPLRFYKVSLIYNNAWLPMYEGIRPEVYTLVATMYPRRYAHRQGMMEIWPSPDTQYTVMIEAYQALGAFALDTDTLTLDRDLVFLTAMAAAKAHPKFNHPDAALYAQMAMAQRRNLQAANHGNKRYVPGADPASPVRPMPIIVNPE